MTVPLKSYALTIDQVPSAAARKQDFISSTHFLERQLNKAPFSVSQACTGLPADKVFLSLPRFRAFGVCRVQTLSQKSESSVYSFCKTGKSSSSNEISDTLENNFLQ
ncbi:hypothetical protein [Noviherbaspirillum pedocola]|uniref:Uncharacterized protein n=1 Tax=Noviherbaspirillum pedocola TaxID=2801341 RepID=A0A934T136_9BURK|nr:hypothetical protein [Noviherbaspirillum pedocola]MBK4739115.1 hypothetical protein [Noviherbaspirillum pedocola]